MEPKVNETSFRPLVLVSDDKGLAVTPTVSVLPAKSSRRVTVSAERLFKLAPQDWRAPRLDRLLKFRLTGSSLPKLVSILESGTRGRVLCRFEHENYPLDLWMDEPLIRRFYRAKLAAFRD